MHQILKTLKPAVESRELTALLRDSIVMAEAILAEDVNVMDRASLASWLAQASRARLDIERLYRRLFFGNLLTLRRRMLSGGGDDRLVKEVNALESAMPMVYELMAELQCLLDLRLIQKKALAMAEADKANSENHPQAKHDGDQRRKHDGR